MDKSFHPPSEICCLRLTRMTAWDTTRTMKQTTEISLLLEMMRISMMWVSVQAILIT